jgi:hypothetical protein
MIVLAAAMLMAGSAAPAAPSHERNALGQCLARFVHDKLNDKMDATAFKAAVKTACQPEQTAFRTGWVNYDVAMKTRRSEAEANADSQIQDYLQNSTESFVDAATPQKPQGPAAASPVKPASSTTPPKP